MTRDGEGVESPTVRQRIEDATMTLIAERGITQVTVSAIAAAADVARQTVYNNYADVDSIVLAAVERGEAAGLQHLRQVLAAVPTSTAKLEQVVRMAVSSDSHGHSIRGFESGLSPGAQKRLRAHTRTIQALVADILREGVERGEFRSDLEPESDAGFTRQVMVAAAEDVVTGSDPVRVTEGASRFILAAVGVRA